MGDRSVRGRAARGLAGLALIALSPGCAAPGGGAGVGAGPAASVALASGETAPCGADHSRIAPPVDCGLVCRAELPVDVADDRAAVTVWINGAPVRLIFDTGAGITALTHAAAERLKLPAAQPGTGALFGINGGQPAAFTTIDNLAFGYVRQDALRVAVVQMGDPRDPTPVDGVLGDDVLFRYEIDLDLPHFVIRLYQGRPCHDRLPGWTSIDGVASFVQRPRGHHVIVPAEVAGQPAEAMLDTGAGNTSIDRALARRAGVPEVQMSDNMRLRMFGLGTAQVAGTYNEVASLDLPGEHLAPYDVTVFDPALRLSGLGWDMLLGEDYWQSHKAWISYATGKVYFAHTW